MKSCIYCGDEFSDERPYDHCMKQECVDTYIIGRRRNMAIDLIPKSGFRVVYKDD